jgi:Mg-chelatase subunit ChlI
MRAPLAHLKAVAEHPLVAVNWPGHDHQALTELGDRGWVAVAEVLLHLVDSPRESTVDRVIRTVDREAVAVVPP